MNANALPFDFCGRVLATGLLTTALISPGIAPIAFADEPSEQNAASAGSANAQDAVVAAEKNETVRVSTDAVGRVESVKVESKLTNPDGASMLRDKTDLTGIASDDRDFSQVGNEIVWDADGEDVTYTGITSASVPINLTITYYLDGNEVAPESLLGKAGHVKVRYEFDNTLVHTRTVAGSSQQMTTPFLIVTGLLVDGDNFHNIKVTNGRVIDDGSRSIVVGYAIPGLQSSIDVSTDDFDIPGYFEFEADVDNFELGPALSLATSSVFEDLDAQSFAALDDIGSMSELQDAMGKLAEGSDELASALSTLADAQNAASDGAESLYEGARATDEGAQQLADALGSAAESVSPMGDAAVQLAAGAETVSQGVAAASAGAKQLESGAMELTDGLGQIVDGSGEAGGLKDAEKGAQELARASAELTSALENLKSGIEQAEQAATALANGLDPTMMQQMAALLGGAKSEIDAYNAKASTIGTEAAAVASDANSAISSITQARAALVEAMQNLDPDDPARPQMEAALANLDTALASSQSVASGAGELESQATSLSTTYTELAASAIDPDAYAQAAQTAQAIADGLGQATAALGDKDTADTIINGSAVIASGNQDLAEGLDSAVEGLDAAKAGSEELHAGASALADQNSGLPAAANGAAQLSSGMREFGSQATALIDGISALDEGASQLAQGTTALAEGVFSLSTALKIIADGSTALGQGSSELTDAINLMNAEGISKLVAAFDGNVEKAKDSMDAIGSMAREYDSFSGKTQGTKGSVRFIFETKGLELE